jgi:hypothetical protein
MVAEIPFDFVVGKTTLHAGKYIFVPVGLTGSTMLLRSSDRKEAIFITPYACSSGRTQLESKLVFRAHGNEHFLWQIWTQGYDMGRELHANPRKIDKANLAQPDPVVILTTLRAP